MAKGSELAELKKTTEGMNQKLDDQMALLRKLADLFASIMSNPTSGPKAEDARTKDVPRTHYHQAVEIKPYSRVEFSDMFKDLVEFYDSKKRTREEMESQTQAGIEREKGNPSGKGTFCSCQANKAHFASPSATMNPQPRTFTGLSMPLSSVYKKLLENNLVKPLVPTPLPQKLPHYHNPNVFCVFHQMPGHATDDCLRLRHKIQDLIDNGTIQVSSL